jgi:hypothetical protein
MENNNLHLVYINPIGKDSNNLYEYEFFFSETPDIVWGQDWNIACPAACENTLPDPETYSEVKTLKTEIPLFCVQQNTCFSIQDCIDGIICLGYFQTDKGVVKFDFSETIYNVNEKIENNNFIFI